MKPSPSAFRYNRILPHHFCLVTDQSVSLLLFGPVTPNNTNQRDEYTKGLFEQNTADKVKKTQQQLKQVCYSYSLSLQMQLTG